MSRRTCPPLLLFLTAIVAMTFVAVDAEGIHYNKRGFKRRELSCRKECLARNEDDVNTFRFLENDLERSQPISPCVAQCISPSCYDLEYNRPLEYGEVDERYDFFRKCVSTQLAEARYKQRDRFYGDDD